MPAAYEEWKEKVMKGFSLDEARKLARGRTPGPWTWVNNSAKDDALIVSTVSGTWVARTFNCDSGPCRDASLISFFGTYADSILDELEAARAVCEAAASVASEPLVNDILLCYSMGMELIARLAEYRSLAKPAKDGT